MIRLILIYYFTLIAVRIESTIITQKYSTSKIYIIVNILHIRKMFQHATIQASQADIF